MMSNNIITKEERDTGIIEDRVFDMTKPLVIPPEIRIIRDCVFLGAGAVADDLEGLYR